MKLLQYHKNKIAAMCHSAGLSHHTARYIIDKMAVGYSCVRRTLYDREIYADARDQIADALRQGPVPLAHKITESQEARREEMQRRRYDDEDK